MKDPALIFDFGGVLIDWKPQRIFVDHFPGDPAAVDAFLNEIRFHEWNAEQDKGRPFSVGVASLQSEFPRYAHILEALHTNWEASVAGPITGSVSAADQDAIVAFLLSLRTFSPEKR